MTLSKEQKALDSNKTTEHISILPSLKILRTIKDRDWSLEVNNEHRDLLFNRVDQVACRTVPRPRLCPRRRAAPEARSGRAPSAARPWPADRAKPLLIRQQVSQGSVRTFAALYRLRRRRAQSRKL